MTRLFFATMTALLLCGCGGNSHNHETASHEHVHMHEFVAYTHTMELFMQHEGLEAGKKSCITLYATTLPSFAPAAAGAAEATLKIGDKSSSYSGEKVENGVFHFDFVPENAGEGTLLFSVGGEKAHFHVKVNAAGEAHIHSHDAEEAHSHAHSHHHGEGDGHAHDHSHGETGHSHMHAGHSHGEHSHAHAHSGHGEAVEGKSGDISFTKQQSWKIDFATELVAASPFNGVVKVAAKVEPVPGNFTTVVATESGKVQFAGNVVAGRNVAGGEALFYIEGSGVTDNDAAVKFAEAESNYELAKAEYERKKLLFTDKIVSEREYLEAEAAYKQAEARYASMKRSYGGDKVVLKSPMAGYVAALLVENGDYVQSGTPLARIEREGDVNIAAELPVRYAPMLQNISSVNVETRQGSVYSLFGEGGRVVAVGKAVNGCSMIPVTLSMRMAEGLIPGSIVTIYMTSAGGSDAGIAVPRTAIVEEMGNFFVFVQNTPVSFEKRAVEPGATDGSHVKITKGVSAGERVVTKGAVVLKLSQGAGALDPHAGHVH